MTSAGEPLATSDLERYLRVLRAAVAGTELDAEQIRIAADMYLAFLTEEHRSQVVQRWLDDRVELEPPAILRGQGGPRPWFQEYDPIDGYHWRRLREYLLTEKGRSERIVDSLDKTSDQILEMLEDPRPQGPQNFRVKGLVIGYVQSGKTANFSAVIAKSFDAGYRIVIVLSGLHNSLRRQTQLRLEDELGLVAPTPGRSGVGLATDDQQISRMTRPEVWGDFQAGTADSSLLYGGGRTILVVKKNASVLRRLVEWLEERQPLTLPVLIIDDEADQASINTGGNRPGEEEDEGTLDEITDLEVDDVDAAVGPDGLRALSRAVAAAETDPSVINGLIRKLLDRMRRVSYVGYTATPFANVLIGHDYYDREVGEDLYPSDFIMSLPRPTGYVGPERLFGRAALAGEGGHDVAGVNVIREVPDWQAGMLLPGRRGASPTALPESLETALLDFVLATAARDTRTGGQPASSMLVHASQLVAQQDVLVELVRARVSTLRQKWRYQREEAEATYRERWESEFMPVSAAIGEERVMTFDQITDAITALFRRELPVMVMHNRSPDELDYERNPNLRAVIVGGNKLSRGLTLEGLLVSFYIRRANAYDTLLQMGRWFGYREDYVDLTRLYTTATLADRFRDLATYEEELRREIRLYELMVPPRTPMDFGPRIRKHPAMQITARNRMGSARTVAYSYAASIQQTIGFELGDPDWLDANINATRRLLSRLGSPNASADEGGRPTWTGVDWRDIERFLNDYETHPDSSRFVASRVRDYIVAQATRHAELTRWTVSIRELLAKDERLGSEDLGLDKPVNCITRSREAASATSIGTLVNPISKGGRGDEDVGLNDDDRRFARESAVGNLSYPLALRQQRSPQEGLLLIYPISRYSRPRDVTTPDGPIENDGKQQLFTDPERGRTVIGIAVSLPDSDSPAAAGQYVVGSAGAAPE